MLHLHPNAMMMLATFAYACEALSRLTGARVCVI